MEFLHQVKPPLVLGKDTMVIMLEDRPCLVKFKKERELSPNQVKNFAATVFEEEPKNKVLIPPFDRGCLAEVPRRYARRTSLLLGGRSITRLSV